MCISFTLSCRLGKDLLHVRSVRLLESKEDLVADLGHQGILKGALTVLIFGDDGALAGPYEVTNDAGVHLLSVAAGQHEGGAAVLVLDAGGLGEAIEESLDDVAGILGRISTCHMKRCAAIIVPFDEGLLTAVVEEIFGDVEGRTLGKHHKENAGLIGHLLHNLAAIFQEEDAADTCPLRLAVARYHLVDDKDLVGRFVLGPLVARLLSDVRAFGRYAIGRIRSTNAELRETLIQYSLGATTDVDGLVGLVVVGIFVCRALLFSTGILLLGDNAVNVRRSIA